MLPHAADQFDNTAAARVAGVAKSLMPYEIDAAAIRSAVEVLSAEAGYAARAREIAAEIAGGLGLTTLEWSSSIDAAPAPSSTPSTGCCTGSASMAGTARSTP
jgi:hypothetical protein